MRKKKRTWIIIILVAWLAVGVIDFCRVFSYEKPLFCIGIQTAQDGGSGKYIGLGYSFDIRGNFVTEDGYHGVSQYVAYICGVEVSRNFMD